jgi:hypothetical protein
MSKIRENIEAWWDARDEDQRELIRRGLWGLCGFLLGAVLL